MGIGCVRFCARSMARAVGCGWGCICHPCFGILMRFCPRFMAVSRYFFYSGLLVLLHLARKHFRRHRITHPAAQRQQGNHEDEEQMAHVVVGGEGVLKVQFMTHRSLPLKTASHGAVA